MNNRGFAITGILYTLFVLFIMILLTVLGTMSYKKGVLEKTVSSLETKFSLTEVNDKSTTYMIDGTTRKAVIDGKYEFVINSKVNEQIHTATCSVYLKKGDLIPTETVIDDEGSNFSLIPSDCNLQTYQIDLNGLDTSVENILILSHVYKFEG